MRRKSKEIWRQGSDYNDLVRELQAVLASHREFTLQVIERMGANLNDKLPKWLRENQ